MENQKEKNVPKILIVDDVETNRYILKNIIEKMGYRPILAENGVQALKIFPICQPNLVLLDIAMPQMDGYEVCEVLKGNPATRNIPIIFISAFDEVKDIVKGFELGGEDYVTKPFIPEVIQVRVGVHLKLYETNQNLLKMNRLLHTSVSEQVKQLEQEKKNVLYAIANIVRKNASYDEKYMERMQYNGRILSQAMQLSSKFESVISDTYIDTVEMAIPLCDIGNVAVPRELLMKKGTLTEEEIEIMQNHTVVGAELLEDIHASTEDNDFIKMAVDIVHYHHENWDGSGYPCGLKEKEIPLSAQIVSVVDSYCALTHDRSWRKAYERTEALEIMEKESGKKYNADIIEICKIIYRQFR